MQCKGTTPHIWLASFCFFKIKKIEFKICKSCFSRCFFPIKFLQYTAMVTVLFLKPFSLFSFYVLLVSASVQHIPIPDPNEIVAPAMLITG